MQIDTQRKIDQGLFSQKYFPYIVIDNNEVQCICSWWFEDAYQKDKRLIIIVNNETLMWTIFEIEHDSRNFYDKYGL